MNKTYIEVLVALQDGKKAYRDGWLGHGKIYIFLKDGDKLPKFSIKAKNDDIYSFIPSEEDKSSNDWNIIE